MRTVGRMEARDAAPPAQRLLAALRGLGCGPAELVALTALVSGALLVPLLLWFVVARPDQRVPTPQELRSPPLGEPTADALVVHVAGEVVAPGLYELPGNARVADALAAAGGPQADAVLDALNLARPLRDGEQLVVPGPGQRAAGAPATAAAGGELPDGRLDLNRASAEELEALPGLGPVLAARIVEYRDEHGGFTDVGELRQVPGIGERKFQQLAELVAV